ncbi:MAG: hypothetical protein P4M11_15915 [Candidatus Pacebacteria bacterium]|nr:hypothetical protein [Candidatus Paceibacterota bacterium]
MKLARECYENLERVNMCANEPFNVLSTGHILKDLGEARKEAVLTSMCRDYIVGAQHKPGEVDYTINAAAMSALIAKYRTWIENTEKAKIGDADKIKPHFDGNSLAKLFGMKPGRVVKHLLSNQFTWQLNHPTGTKAEYEDYVAKNKESIVSSLMDEK